MHSGIVIENGLWSHLTCRYQSFWPPVLILYVWKNAEEDSAPLVSVWYSLHFASPLTQLRCYQARPASLYCLILWPPQPHPLPPQPPTWPHPRLKCLNTSPLHVLVVKVRWVHGKKAADNYFFPVSESVFHLTFSNKKEPFPHVIPEIC